MDHEVGLYMIQKQMTDTVWLGDSGASWHMCNSDRGLTKWRTINTSIKIGDGKLL